MIELKLIITNIIVGITVAILTFIFGLRAGKNQVDRSTLKEKYKNLFVYFEDIYNSLNKGILLRWNSFKPIDTRTGSYSGTPLRNMIIDGSILDLDDRLIAKLKLTEKLALNLGSNIFIFIEIVNNQLPEILSKYLINGLIKEPYHYYSRKNEKYRYISIDLRNILMPNFLDHYNSFNEDKSLWLQIDFNNNGSHIWYSICPEDVKSKSIYLLLSELSKAFEEFDEYSKLKSEQIPIKIKLEKILNKLKRKSKEPHSFWGTAITGITDLFKS
ncbi:hypothetical protein DLM76_21255 [Leptospira yasudae]|uniref:hypothetical protein n=1 Tax=Leptospira yasudae TaxID=2202201 RepID=UPI000E59B997|nr:hypothetical protein [Leptospira yasudae]RHX89539.1 hypothetical protein DLM76_21255 [Leptospira yasudae]